MTDQATTAALPDLTARVLQILSTSAKPLTVKTLKDRLKGEKASEDSVRAVLKDLELRGQVFTCSTYRNAPRYWDRDEAHLATEKLHELIRDHPLSEKELIKRLGKALGTKASEAWRTRQVKSLRQTPGVYLYPPSPKKPSLRLGLQPVDPADYFTKESLKAVEAVCQKLESVGVTRSAVVEALGKLVNTDRTATNREPLPNRDAELRQLIMKGMLEIDRDADEGALVSFRELRRQLPSEYQTRDTFDRVILELAVQGGYVLHRHNFPGMLSEDELRDMVQDAQGNIFMGIARRV